MARISYTEKEVELLARLIKSEALGEGEEGMLLVGNVVVNRVVANCDIFRNVRTISEVVYQTNQFAGVGQPLFNEPVSQNEKDIALRCIYKFSVHKYIEMNPPRTPYGLKILAQMLIVQKRFMEDYLENIKNIVFITQG